MWFAFMLSSGGGLMVISALKDFGVTEKGMSEASAEQALGLLALFNGLGRITWGTIGQRFGPRFAAVALMLSQAAMLAALPRIGGTVSLLAVGACWVGFNFGGNLSVFPLMTAERFGLRHLGANYGMVSPPTASAGWSGRSSPAASGIRCIRTSGLSGPPAPPASWPPPSSAASVARRPARWDRRDKAVLDPESPPFW